MKSKMGTNIMLHWELKNNKNNPILKLLLQVSYINLSKGPPPTKRNAFFHPGYP